MNASSPSDGQVLSYDTASGKWVASSAAGGGAPTTADYLVGTANAGLSAEIAVGTTPGGELGGTWASPTVDTVHSGSSHAATQAAAEATAAAALTTHEADTTSVHGIADTSTLYRSGGTDVAVADGGTGSSTASAARTALGVEIGTDVASQATADAKVAKSLYDANTVLKADTDDTPAALTMGASTILARLAAGGIVAATPAELRTLLTLVVGTDVEAHDADLTTIAGLTPTNDDVLQRKAGAWANRTIAQLLTDLGLGALYQPLDSDLTAVAALTTTSYGRAFLALADAAAARTATGSVIGTNVQAWDADLDAIAALTSAANKMPYSTAAQTWALADLSAFARTLLDDADAATALATLGAYGAGGTDVAVADGGTGASTAATARSNLGIAAAVGGAEWTVVTKGGDTSVTSSSTLANDADLFFTAVSGGLYEIEFVLMYANPLGAGTPDIKFAFGEDATARGSFVGASLNSADASQATTALSNQSGAITCGTAAANRPARILGSHVGAGGTFRLLWAQANGDANPSTLRAGSLMRYRRIV